MGWAEAYTLFHTFGFWVGVALLSLVIIIQYLVRPCLTKFSGGFHTLVKHSNRQVRASLHPTRKINESELDLISRQEIINEIEGLKDELRHNHKDTEENFEKFTSILATKLCTEHCPVYAVLKEMTTTMIGSNTELHRRLDTFLDTSMATVLAAVEKRISERKNGGS